MNREINKYTNKLTDKQITKKRKKACNDTYFVNLDPPIIHTTTILGGLGKKSFSTEFPKNCKT